MCHSDVTIQLIGRQRESKLGFDGHHPREVLGVDPSVRIATTHQFVLIGRKRRPLSWEIKA
jgi:hypothetical protein